MSLFSLSFSSRSVIFFCKETKPLIYPNWLDSRCKGIPFRRKMDNTLWQGWGSTASASRKTAKPPRTGQMRTIRPRRCSRRTHIISDPTADLTCSLCFWGSRKQWNTDCRNARTSTSCDCPHNRPRECAGAHQGQLLEPASTTAIPASCPSEGNSKHLNYLNRQSNISVH